jgi:putative membrane protein
MISKLHSALGVLASLGLAGVVACGNAMGGETSTDEQSWSTPDSGVAPQGDACVPTATFQITDCSPGQIVAILRAVNTAELRVAVVAQRTTSNADVRAFATTIINDDTNLDRQLTAFLDTSGLTAIESDISLQITGRADGARASLQTSRQFDRDFIAGMVIDHVTALGLLEHVVILSQPQGNLVQLSTLLASATVTVKQHVQLAFQLETRLIGACGTHVVVTPPPPVDAGADCATVHDAAVVPSIDSGTIR